MPTYLTTNCLLVQILLTTSSDEFQNKQKYDACMRDAFIVALICYTFIYTTRFMVEDTDLLVLTKVTWFPPHMDYQHWIGNQSKVAVVR